MMGEVREDGGTTAAVERTPGQLDAVPDALLAITADGAIALVDGDTERLFGYGPEELVGQPVDVLVPDAYRTPRTGERLRSTGAGRPLTLRRRDGRAFPAEVRLGALDTDDGPLVAAVVRDASGPGAHLEDDRLATKLQQAQRLESLGQLAGGVAHDFNNLLAVIVNYAAFVAEEIELAAVADPDRWHAVARDVQQIQRAADRGIALTHQLLAFGRREVVRPRVLSLNAVVRDVKALLQRSIGEHVQLVTVPAAGLWPARVDRGQMEQVLVNLAVNARDAMPGGGTLTIDTANVVLEEDMVGGRPGMRPGRYVRIRVQDTGTGMPKAVIERAFEPFFTTKPKGEGTGLGLATVYGIVIQAGGDVQIYSEPDIGTTFNVFLPATDEPVEVADDDPPAVAPAPGNGEHVLVVEDEPAIREVTRRILERNGYHVSTAGSGAEALALAEHQPGRMDLLMTDVVMPRMLGKEIAERLRARRPGLAVLYMSGYARPVLANTGTLEPGVTLLEKPFSETGLLAAVRQVLDA